MDQPPKKKAKITSQSFRGFVPVNSEVAGKKKTQNVPREITAVPLDHLTLDSKQKASIDAIYSTSKNYLGVFDPIKEEEQAIAASILAANRLDTEARQCIDNRWTIKWSVKKGKGRNETSRVLYQCSCGYDHTVAGSKKRLASIPFTGCLVHAEVVYEVHTHHVLLIRGYFEHNEGCLTAEYTRAPTLPVHPIVYQHALEQLKKGMTWKQVKDSNHSMYTARTYPDMPRDLGSSRYRWILHTTDHRSLYRQFSRIHGPDMIHDDRMNVHDLSEDDEGDIRIHETVHSETSTPAVTANELGSPSMAAAMSETSSDSDGDQSELSLRLSELDEIMKQPANGQTVSRALRGLEKIAPLLAQSVAQLKHVDFEQLPDGDAARGIVKTFGTALRGVTRQLDRMLEEVGESASNAHALPSTPSTSNPSA